ncbi:MAG TPA: hypothetical protein VGY54_03465 [Polyangiaceae bacterium]|jgi:hypothetical protein|nr:hypothetical protein [Polyangiaceae bacterium]
MSESELVERTLAPPGCRRSRDPELGRDYLLWLATKDAYEDCGVIRAQAPVCAIEVGDKVDPVAGGAFTPGSESAASQVFPDAGKQACGGAGLVGIECGPRKRIVRVSGRPAGEQAGSGSYDGGLVARRGILFCNGYLANRGHGHRVTYASIDR